MTDKVATRRILVVGWLPPPFNGRSHEVASLLRPPFTQEFDIASFDTKLRDAKGGSRPSGSLFRHAATRLKSFPRTLAETEPDLVVFFTGPGMAFWYDLLLL